MFTILVTGYIKLVHDTLHHQIEDVCETLCMIGLPREVSQLSRQFIDHLIITGGIITCYTQNLQRYQAYQQVC
jgi:hypothetical protein